MRVIDVQVPERYRLRLTFGDGVSGGVDLGDLVGQGVFSAWLQPGAFEDLSIGSGGEVAWSSGVDLCADALYLRLSGKTPEEIFPALAIGETVA